jgi:cyclin E
VAAKLEEIYPPKLKTFAYVTDGACSEGEILDMELVLMKQLKWKLTPITPATWVNIYLQILAYRSGPIVCTRSGSDFVRSSIRDSNKPSDARLIKHLYDRVDYVRVIRLVDLAILDAQSLNFTYSMLSAAAIYHIKGN